MINFKFNTDNSNIIVTGTVEEFIAETNSIVLVPDESSSSSSDDVDKITIPLDDVVVDIINTTLSARTNHVSEAYKAKVFLFGDTEDPSLNNFKLRKYLEQIVPSTNNILEIIRKKSKHDEFNFKILHELLNEYNVSLNDFTFLQLADIFAKLRKNIQNELKEVEKDNTNI